MAAEQTNKKDKLDFGYPWKSLVIVLAIAIVLLVFFA